MSIKSKRGLIALALATLCFGAQAAPWAYRGTLEDGGVPANGRYDLRLSLLDANGGKSIGGAITFADVQVSNGSFSVDVDFGFDLTRFAALKLKTEVQQAGSGFVSIGEPTPFDAKAALAGICWDTTGNVVAPGEFLGATNDVGVEIKAANLRTARFKAAGSAMAYGDAPQIALGSASNVASGVGATVSGGGATRDSMGMVVATLNNVASGNFAVVSGGTGNIASANDSVVSGGSLHMASAVSSAIGGGSFNRASGPHGFVGGGNSNYASGNFSTVAGGRRNTASAESAIASGDETCAGSFYSFAAGRRAKIRPGIASSIGEVGAGCLGVPTSDADGDNGTFVWADSTAADFTSTGPNQFLIRANGGVAINTAVPTANAALTVAGDVDVPNPGELSFGSTTRQMLNLWGPASYGIGVQGSRLYFRAAPMGGFNWFEGGVHNDTADNAGGGTRRMTLSAGGQLTTTTGTINMISDGRLKTAVRDYSGALDQLSQLRPVHYRYSNAGKADFQPEGEHLGFIAQEVRTVFPQWVNTDDSGYLSLSMRGFEAVAVEAIQELNSKLEVENSELRSALQAAIKRLDSLEARINSRPR